MADGIKVFENQEFGSVRTLVVEGEPWFVGKDVAAALGYGSGKSLNNAVAKHVDDEDKGVTEMMTTGGKQNIVIINESGLYSLVLSSKLESAKKFKRWVTSEVLPGIRKTVAVLESVEYCGAMDDIVYAKSGIVATTSRSIAKVFQRNHKDIVCVIEGKLHSGNAQCAQFCAHHIRTIEYLDSRNRMQHEYELDEEGFSLVALSLTGEKADIFKIQYIEAFSRMKKALADMFKARVVESVLPQDSRLRQYIYIIKNPLNETIKIGVAQDVEKRLHQLQTGAGVELELVYQSMVCSNAFSIERDVHAHFEKYRTFGEWFKLNPDAAINYLERQNFVLKSEFCKYVSPLKHLTAAKQEGAI